ncbi:hypothetical protein BH11BAC7_BH11BAC7_26660 [soil metagenome]
MEKKNVSDSIAVHSAAHAAQTELIKNYYLWYNKHSDEINEFNLVKNCPNNGDTTLTYAVDFNGTEKWLKKFQSSGMVSENFIYHWRNYFKECDEALQDEKAWDGPPAGFDYNLIYNSQEENPSDAELKKAEFVSAKPHGSQFIVTVAIPGFYDSLITHVENTPDGWKVAQ